MNYDCPSQEMIKECDAKRAANQPTIPTTIGQVLHMWSLNVKNGLIIETSVFHVYSKYGGYLNS